MRIFVIITLWLILPSVAWAQSVNASDFVRYCPATDEAEGPPDFTAEDCHRASLSEIDPQGDYIWLEVRTQVSAQMLAGAQPLAIRVTGKASSIVYVNGVQVGSNGLPADTRTEEVPGLMDAILFVPRDLFFEGENILALKLSSHHGLIRLTEPLHNISVIPYQSPTESILSAYANIIPWLGVFILSTGLFTLSAVQGLHRERAGLVALFSFMVGAQLLSEIGRGLWAYPYPFHDWRLIAITASALFGSLTLFALLQHRFTQMNWKLRAISAFCLSLVLITIAVQPIGFDAKTGWVWLMTFTIGGALCLVQGLRQDRVALFYAAGLGLSGALLLWTQGEFLDTYLYPIAGVFLLHLGSQQVLAYARERRFRLDEQRRAHALETALLRARQDARPQRLTLVSAGKTEFADTRKIVFLKAAGDYVEIIFENGRHDLFTGTLTAMEEKLPDTFLRVHRSHIVNTAYVQRLERDPGGAGNLLLSNGTRIPVSRRILPHVRDALENELAD